MDDPRGFLGLIGMKEKTMPHMELGKKLASFGVAVTKDIYGNGPEEHGSAWKFPTTKYAAIIGWLAAQGFSKKKKANGATMKRGNLSVDITPDGFLYITD